ncbi:MAG: WbqC family protein [Myxococcota bacterium]|nr:WbqC family protein [Deltaproteobacteria bacterium]MDQ3340883.1 WbqC family protein [Myxococcota bacterium]
MIVTNHQPQYFPYLGFFHKVENADLLVVMDDVQFLERGFQHRNYIKMQTGKQWITVPVVQERGQLISEVKIDPTQNWRRKHWAALQTNYSKAPYWKQLSPELEAILVAGGHTTLVALDVDLMKWAMKILGITTPLRLASELAPTGAKSEYHISVCKLVGADTYLSGAGGKLYMDMALFEATNVGVTFQTYAAREYPQLYPQHGFIPDLAVVDAIFNVGPEARALITEAAAP